MLPIIPFNSFSSTSRGARTTPSQRVASARSSAIRCCHSRLGHGCPPPARTPVGAAERIFPLAPAVHQRQAIADMVHMRRNRRTGRRARRCIRRRQLLERAEQPFVAGVQHVAALFRRAIHQLCQKRSERVRDIGGVHVSPTFAGGTPRWNRESAASGLFLEKPGFALPQNFPARYVALRTRVCRSR